MFERKTKAMNFQEYPSWDEFLDVISSSEMHWGKESQSNSKSFTGTETWDEAMDLARRGWPEGRELMHEIHREMMGEIKIKDINMILPSAGGGVLSVPRYLAGDCEIFDCPDSVQVPSRVLKVVIAIDTACSTGVDQIMRRGAAVLSYVDALENAGYMCEVWIQNRVKYGSKKGSTIEAAFKYPNQYLDLDQAAFAMAHPSTLRRLIFKAMERDEELSHLSKSYGMPAGQRPDDCDVFIPRFVPNDNREALDRVFEAIKTDINLGEAA